MRIGPRIRREWPVKFLSSHAVYFRGGGEYDALPGTWRSSAPPAGFLKSRLKTRSGLRVIDRRAMATRMIAALAHVADPLAVDGDVAPSK